jgi:hypothetical protein
MGASPAVHIFKDMSNRLEKTDQYIPAGQKQEFELQVAARLNDLVGELIERSDSFISLHRKKEFELHVMWALANCIQELFNDALARSDGASEKIKDIWLGLRSKAEAISRRLELQSPSSPESFRATLWWMGERGLEEELDLVRQVKKNPPYPSGDILQLLADTEEKTAKRVEDPAYITRTGEETYQRYKHIWDRLYEGKYVAIYQNDVIASHHDESKLIEEIIWRQKKKGPFRAYIVETGASVLSLRKPKHQFRDEENRSEESNDEQGARLDLQRLGWEAFRRHLPQLLKQHNGKWVAYHGQLRVALADSHPEIYDKIIEHGLPLNEMLVCCVEPLGPPLDLRRFRA